MHHYPDPGVRFGSRSGSGKNCHVVNTHRRDTLQKAFSNSIMLAFGGGLCSLSTSSYYQEVLRSVVCVCLFNGWFIRSYFGAKYLKHGWLGSNDHQQEMAYGESNGNAIDDVM